MRFLPLLILVGGCAAKTPAPIVESAAPQIKSHTSPPLRKPGPSDNGVAVLTWHKIAPGPNSYTVTTPEKFAQQLAFLKAQHATVMRLEDAVRLVKAGKPLPPRAVALGFDDGFKSCYTRVFPLLRKYNWPATLYIYPDWIGAANDSLSWDELRAMQKSGLVDVQSHSMGHPNLVLMGAKLGLTYDQRLRHELLASKQILEKQMGARVTQLAFPFGFYNEEVLAQTKRAGYDSSWTVNASPFRAQFAEGETWFSAPRYLVFRGDSMTTFARYAFAKPLKVSNLSPAPNRTGTNHLPTISARLGEDVNPRSVRMRLAIIQNVAATYNPQTRVVSYRPRRALHKGVWTVSVSALDKRGQSKAASWAFIVR